MEACGQMISKQMTGHQVPKAPKLKYLGPQSPIIFALGPLGSQGHPQLPETLNPISLSSCGSTRGDIEDNPASRVAGEKGTCHQVWYVGGFGGGL